MDKKLEISMLSLVFRIAIGLVLIVAGLSKLTSPPEEFSVVIQAYDIVSPASALTLAALLPWLEVFLGFCLLFGFATKQASIAAGLLLLSFLFALLSTKVRGIELPNCGCFGSSFHSSITEASLMDALLLVCSFFSFHSGAKRFSLDAWAAGS